MYRRIVIGILCFFIMVQRSISVLASEENENGLRAAELYAKSAVLMDADSGRVLYEKNGYEALANASTTKILTCIVALENCDLSSVATASSYAASRPKVHLGMREGQKFYIKDMLYGLMLESFNDCAVVIAEHIAGDVKGFADMMNRKAEEIGCEDSYFITPNGLDGKDEISFHHTTAADLAKIMRYCIKQSPKTQEFLEITRTQQYSFSDIDNTRSYTCNNHNAFLHMMEGALSGKTGFTGNAGYCYVGALERDDETYIVALLACGWPNNKSYKWSDTKKLMTYGIENFYKQNLDEIIPDETELKPILVEDGQGNAIGGATTVCPIVNGFEGYRELLLKEGESVTLRYELVDKVLAPVAAGEYLGKVCYMLGDEVLKECSVTAGNSVEKIDFTWCFDRVVEQMWLAR